MTKTKKSELRLFEKLSAILTGFSLADIEGTGMSKTYWQVLRDKEPEGAEDLIQAFQQLKLEPDALTENDLRMIEVVLEDPFLGPLSQQVIMMWYTGQWNFGSPDTYVISAEAYIQSFSFVAAGSHPAAAKQPGFGTWQFPPQSSKEPQQK